MRELRVFPDISVLPADFQTIAQLCNRETDALTSQVVALVESASQTKEIEALKKLGELQKAYPRSFEKYRGVFQPVWSNANRNAPRSWMKLSGSAYLSIYYRHENWAGCALGCVFVGDWDQEVYYWRKAGIPGRLVLAARSAGRAVTGRSRTRSHGGG